jgi:hypothetical protein
MNYELGIKKGFVGKTNYGADEYDGDRVRTLLQFAPSAARCVDVLELKNDHAHGYGDQTRS